VAVILKVLLINLLSALNFSNVFLNKKRLENKKREKTFLHLRKLQPRTRRDTIFPQSVKRTSLCVQPTTAAVNVTLLAFAADRRAAAAPLLAMQESIDISAAGPTAANPPHAAAAVDS